MDEHNVSAKTSNNKLRTSIANEVNEASYRIRNISICENRRRLRKFSPSRPRLGFFDFEDKDDLFAVSPRRARVRGFDTPRRL